MPFIWQLRAGDAEEHALLLANFFTALSIPTYVVVGTGIPEGDTTYVLTVKGVNEMWLWNACAGSRCGSRRNVALECLRGVKVR